MKAPGHRSYKGLIWTLSILLPLTVAVLYLSPKAQLLGLERGTLPAINSVINACTAILLIWAYVAIRSGQRTEHKRIMLTAVGSSALFLVLYVTQHASFPSASYEGPHPALYYFVLLSHILLAVIIVPLVLITLTRALSERFDKHRRIARITLPIWLYVSITGVVVYWMIRPFY